MVAIDLIKGKYKLFGNSCNPRPYSFGTYQMSTWIWMVETRLFISVGIDSSLGQWVNPLITQRRGIEFCTLDATRLYRQFASWKTTPKLKPQFCQRVLSCNKHGREWALTPQALWLQKMFLTWNQDIFVHCDECPGVLELLALCHNSPLHSCISRCLERSLPFANWLPNVERALRSPYVFPARKLASASLYFLKRKVPYIVDLIVQFVPWYLSHCTCFCFAGKQVPVNWVSRIIQVRKPMVAKRAIVYSTEYEALSLCIFGSYDNVPLGVDDCGLWQPGLCMDVAAMTALDNVSFFRWMSVWIWISGLLERFFYKDIRCNWRR